MAGKKKRITNAKKYQAYKTSGIREKNKARKLIKVLERDPNCTTARQALERLPSSAVTFARDRLADARKHTQ